MSRLKRIPNAKPGMLTDRRTHPMRAIWSGIAVLLLVMLSIPIFAEAVDGQTADTSPLGTQTTALVAAIGTLGEQVRSLQTDISGLRTAFSGAPSVDATEALADGMPECLQACRVKLAECLSSDTASASSPLRITRVTRPLPMPLFVRLVPLDPCRLGANECMNVCRPKTTSILPCEDRCAVALGACVDAAGTDAAELADCRMSNQQCLIAACLETSPSQESMDRVPQSKCADQCRRALRICRSGAAFDQAILDTCEQTSYRCLTLLCAAPASRLPTEQTDSAGIAPPSVGTIRTAPIVEEKTEMTRCEEVCARDFDACRAKSDGNPEALSACDTSQKICREACLEEAGAKDEENGTEKETER